MDRQESESVTGEVSVLAVNPSGHHTLERPSGSMAVAHAFILISPCQTSKIPLLPNA